MKGNPQILEALNQLLADELTAINQYIVEAEMCENWGYDKLHHALQKHELKDQGTVDLLMKILNMEEGHIDWAEAQLDQIEHMGLANYLSMQSEGASE